MKLCAGILQLVLIGFVTVSGQSLSDMDLSAYSCPCLHREYLTFAFMSHHRDSTTVGSQLLAGARQAVRDRGLYLHEDYPRDNFRLLPVLISANAAGIPVYIVGGADPDLVESLQSRDAMLSPVRASIRHVGADESGTALTLARRLLASGITHLDCVTTDIGNMAWNFRCRTLIAEFERAGATAQRHLRVATEGDLAAYVDHLEHAHPEMPGREMVVVVMETYVYQGISAGLARSSKPEATLVVYETSVVALSDVAAGANVMAVDTGFYAQAYLAVALASAERQTGQMVTSDIETEVTVYGGNSGAEVTDAIVQREVCRAAGNPVCGDPRVLPVTPSGCACFNRSEVNFRVVGAFPAGVPFTYQLWQGVKDAERDLQGSSFEWHVDSEAFFEGVVAEYSAVLSNATVSGVISLDAVFAPMMPRIMSAIQSLASSPKPLYLAYLHALPTGPLLNVTLSGSPNASGTPGVSTVPSTGSNATGGVVGAANATTGLADGATIPDASSISGYSTNATALIPPGLDLFGARAAVVTDPRSSGMLVAKFSAQLGAQHVLANNALVASPWAWQLMEGLVSGILGEGYAFKEGTWAWPLTKAGSPGDHTGAWSLFVAPQTNRTVQVINGVNPLQGLEFLPPLQKRLFNDLPAADMLVLQSLDTLIGPVTLSLLASLSVAQPHRAPVRLVTHKCSAAEFLALLRNGSLVGEEHLAGCVDEQAYLSTYLAATAAALEQQTGERIVGEVHTERLLRADLLPPDFVARASCELVGYRDGIKPGAFGAFYPVCVSKKSCISALSITTGSDVDTSAYLVCSGHGSCHFGSETDNDPAARNASADYKRGACTCNDGWGGNYCEILIDTNGVTPLPGGGAGARIKVLVAVLVSSMSVLMLSAALPVMYRLRARKHQRQDAVEEFLRKRAPPTKEESITAVITDIEGSTSLWESHPESMKTALGIHHYVLRSLLPKYHGYESDTEGDSFSLVFHHPTDALSWAMDVQRNLLAPDKMPKTSDAHRGVQSPMKPRMHRRSYDEFGAVDWPPELLASGVAAEVKDPVNGSVIYRGLRVRMGIHIGRPDACVLHPNGRQHYVGEMVEVTKAIADAAASGGQVLMSMTAWQALGVHVPGVTCHHMGRHELGEKLPAIHLMQVLPEELAKRAPFAPLKSKQLRPSFFEAPAAECYVKGVMPTEAMVIAFMYVGGAKVLRRCPAYVQAVAVLVEFVQGVMPRFNAYEVEEKDGNFLLAFRSAVDAAHFAEAVQREAMALDWPEELLEQDLAAEVVKTGDEDGADARVDVVVFRGLRLQIGMCMGVPSDCQPHMATGRAAYFGPVVNRAARIAATAAPGQTLVNRGLYDAAKSCSPDLFFKDMGNFILKGVKDSMHLYQVSSPTLSARLFPRTLKLARSALSKARVFQLPVPDEDKVTPRAVSLLRTSSSFSGSSAGGQSSGGGAPRRSLSGEDLKLIRLKDGAGPCRHSPRHAELEQQYRAQCKNMSFDDLVNMLVATRIELMEAREQGSAGCQNK